MKKQMQNKYFESFSNRNIPVAGLTWHDSGMDKCLSAVYAVPWVMIFAVERFPVFVIYIQKSMMN